MALKDFTKDNSSLTISRFTTCKTCYRHIHYARFLSLCWLLTGKTKLPSQYRGLFNVIFQDSVMHHLSRLDKAFLRKGSNFPAPTILFHYLVHQVPCPRTAAGRTAAGRKSSNTTADFAEVKLPDHPGYVRQTCASQIFIPAMASPLARWWPQRRFSHSRRHRHRYFLWHTAADDGLTLEQAEAHKDIIAQRLTQCCCKMSAMFRYPHRRSLRF